jgi:hypothetical protein
MVESTLGHVLLEFVGGYWDGKFLDNESDDGMEAQLANGYYRQTGDGAVGQGFSGVSPEAAEFAQIRGWQAEEDPALAADHAYQVVERLEEDDEILVRFQYGLKG